jgi:hypothetical protein
VSNTNIKEIICPKSQKKRFVRGYVKKYLKFAVLVGDFNPTPKPSVEVPLRKRGIWGYFKTLTKNPS